MSQFQILKVFGRWFPGATGETLGIVLFTGGLLFWSLVPLFDLSQKNGRLARLFTVLGLGVMIALIVITIWGYLEI